MSVSGGGRGRPGLDIGTYGAIRKYQLDSGPWQADTLFRDERGTVRRVRARGKSGAASERALKRKLTDLVEQCGQSDNNLTSASRVDDLYRVWIEQRRTDPSIRVQTVQGYEGDYERYVSPQLGALKLRELTVPRVDRFLTDTARISPRRAKATRTVLAQMVGMAVRYGAMPANTVRDASLVRVPKTQPRALTDEEVADLYSALRAWTAQEPKSGPRRKDTLLHMVTLMLGTGLRIGEALALRWQDVDLVAQPPRLTISGTLVTPKKSPMFYQPEPKTASGHHVVMIPGYVAVMLLQRQVEAGHSHVDAVFPSQGGGWTAPCNLRRQWRQAVTGTSVEWTTPHSLRRTVATRIERQYGSKQAAAQLGHSSDQVTTAHYIEKLAMAPDSTDVLSGLAETLEN